MYRQITYEQRVQIALMLRQGEKKIKIAKMIGCSVRSIYYELNRNSSEGSYKCYNANQAQTRRDQRRFNSNRPTSITEEMVSDIRKYIGNKKWSPEQLFGRWRKEGKTMVSVETIYRYIYFIDRKEGGNLVLSLRQAHRTRRRRRNTKDKRGTIKNRIFIDERPNVVNERRRYGDFEGDTIEGKSHQSRIATMTERKSLYTILIPLKSKESIHTATQIIKGMRPYKKLCHTITFDNGKEFAGHKIISKSLEASVYFAHPYSSFERGTNENCNGLIRQYYPKGTDFKLIKTTQLKKVQKELNDRPRKKLKYKTPNEVFLQKCETSN